jgi:hypothetical protein
LGDEQYDSGTSAEFAGAFEPSWGRFKPLIHPAVGNHEYLTSGASGYFDYFGGAAGDPTKGYYSFDLGDWHLIALNSNCEYVSCAAGAPQEQWLRADLASHSPRCTLAYWHHPLFTSGPSNGQADGLATRPLWQALYDNRADVVLNGHDHDYERFAPQAPSGQSDPNGIREFVVGTGGKSHFAFGTISPNSEVHNADSFGVLLLALDSASYTWRFVPENAGGFNDQGAAQCHRSGQQTNHTTALAAVSGLAFSNKTFAAENSGPPAAKAKRKRPPRGTKVSFRLNEAATVRFTVSQRVKGRKGKHGKKRACAKPTKKNRKRGRCTRVVTLNGSFTRNGGAGKNSFHFSGRLNGRKLKPGRYRLVATPSAGGRKGKPTSVGFRIVR